MYHKIPLNFEIVVSIDAENTEHAKEIVSALDTIDILEMLLEQSCEALYLQEPVISNYKH